MEARRNLLADFWSLAPDPAEGADVFAEALAKRGESLQVSPEMVGHRLKSLGFRTEPIGSGGKGLWLLGDVCGAIHKLAPEYGVRQDPVVGCMHCRIPRLSPQKEEQRGGKEERIHDNSDASSDFSPR